MGKFKQRPVVIEAIQWTGDNLDAVKEFAGAEFVRYQSGGFVLLPAADGHVLARKGDWIIRDYVGVFSRCVADVFEATYEAVTEGE